MLLWDLAESKSVRNSDELLTKSDHRQGGVVRLVNNNNNNNHLI